jgi:hypothetical protein
MSRTRSRGANAHILAFGGLSLYARKLFAAILSLRGTDAILSAGGVDINQTVAHRTTKVELQGTPCTSPPQELVQSVSGHRADPELAKLTQGDWEPLVAFMADKLLASQLPTNARLAQVAAFIGLRTGHWELFEYCIRRLKKSDKTLAVIPFSNVSAQYDQRLVAAVGLENFARLVREGLIMPPFLFDNDGNYARAYTEAKQDLALAKALAALFCGSSIMLRNRALAEVSGTLSKNSIFSAIAVASMPIESYEETFSDKVGRFLSGTNRRFNVTSRDHFINQAGVALEMVMNEPTAQTMADPPRRGQPVHASFIIPYPLKQENREDWEQLTSGIQQVVRRWGTVSSFYVAGQGAPHPGHQGSAWLQCSLYYSLPDEPTIPLSDTNPHDGEPLLSDALRARVIHAEPSSGPVKDFLPSPLSRNGNS